LTSTFSYIPQLAIEIAEGYWDVKAGDLIMLR